MTDGTIYRARADVEVEAMRWCGHKKRGDCWNQPTYPAEDIVAWVNANGGEAWYEPSYERMIDPDRVMDEPARIAVRTINGLAYAASGHYIVMGDESFVLGSESGWNEDLMCRDFYPCDPATFEKRWEKKPLQDDVGPEPLKELPPGLDNLSKGMRDV